MTNETEKKFFDAFGIKPEHYEYCYHECRIPELANIPCDKKDCPHYRIEIYYPEITDRILLELIEIIIKRDFGIHIDHDADGYGIASENYSGHFEKILKDSVLDFLITNKTQFYHQVRELFGVRD